VKWRRQSQPRLHPPPASFRSNTPRADNPYLPSGLPFVILSKQREIGSGRVLCDALRPTSAFDSLPYAGFGESELPFTSSLSTIASAISFIALRF